MNEATGPGMIFKMEKNRAKDRDEWKMFIRGLYPDMGDGQRWYKLNMEPLNRFL